MLVFKIAEARAEIVGLILALTYVFIFSAHDLNILRN